MLISIASFVSVAAIGIPQLTAYSIGGGGAATNGGTLTLTCTIGRYEATTAPLTVGSYEFCGGYWPGFPAPVCAADFNHDSAVDFFDYLDFVDAFSAGLPASDFNADGAIDFFDYLDFVDAFSVGC